MLLPNDTEVFGVKPSAVLFGCLEFHEFFVKKIYHSLSTAGGDEGNAIMDF